MMKAVEMETDKHGVTTDRHSCSVMSISADIALDLKPNTSYAVVAIEIPAGQRLVTEEEQDKYKISESCLYYCFGRSNWYNCKVGGVLFSGIDIYAVPIDHVWAEDEVPELNVTATLNGKEIDPSTISEETKRKIIKMYLNPKEPSE